MLNILRYFLWLFNLTIIHRGLPRFFDPNGPLLHFCFSEKQSFVYMSVISRPKFLLSFRCWNPVNSATSTFWEKWDLGVKNANSYGIGVCPSVDETFPLCNLNLYPWVVGWGCISYGSDSFINTSAIPHELVGVFMVRFSRNLLGTFVSRSCRMDANMHWSYGPWIGWNGLFQGSWHHI